MMGVSCITYLLLACVLVGFIAINTLLCGRVQPDDVIQLNHIIRLQYWFVKLRSRLYDIKTCHRTNLFSCVPFGSETILSQPFFVWKMRSKQRHILKKLLWRINLTRFTDKARTFFCTKKSWLSQTAVCCRQNNTKRLLSL